jgi:hypothetical protein
MTTLTYEVKKIKGCRLPYGFIRVDAYLADGRIVPVFGVWKERGEYLNDTNGRTFHTMAEV